MEFSVLILAGGKSSRMNYQDKACLQVEGETFLERLLKQFEPKTQQIIISEGKTTNRIYEFEMKNVEYVRDFYEECGPLSGLQAGLSVCRNHALYVAACDMPKLEFGLYEYLAVYDDIQYDAIIPTTSGKIHPLAGIYKKQILRMIEEQLESKDYAVRHLLEKIRVRYVELDNQVYVSMLENVNTYEEYKNVLIEKGNTE